MTRLLLCAWALELVAATSPQPSQLSALPPPFPREAVSKAFENDRVVVWQGLVGIKSRPTPVHRHTLEMVGVFLDAGLRIRTIAPDGSSSESPKPLQAGSVVFQKAGVVHSEDALVDGIRAVAIELKEPGLRPSSASPESGTPLDGGPTIMDNDRVSVWEHRWKTAVTAGAIAARRDAIVIMLESGTLRSPSSIEDRRTFGQVYFTTVERIARERVAAGTPRAIVVALK